jgi:hypothetical protein
MDDSNLLETRSRKAMHLLASYIEPLRKRAGLTARASGTFVAILLRELLQKYHHRNFATHPALNIALYPDSIMADTTSLLSTTTRTTTLGNTISSKMLSFLDSVSSPPTGFRSLGLDFLSIIQILNSLSSSLSSHFTTSTLPPQAVSELTKILTQTLKDFENLQTLLEKFMDYEKGGAVGRVMKTWRSVFADKDIAKVRDSLKANKGALTMALYLTDM